MTTARPTPSSERGASAFSLLAVCRFHMRGEFAIGVALCVFLRAALLAAHSRALRARRLGAK